MNSGTRRVPESKGGKNLLAGDTSQFVFDYGLDFRIGLVSGKQPAVHKQRRSSGDTKPRTFLDIGGDSVCMASRIETRIERLRIELQIHCALFQIGHAEFVLFAEHGVMKLPEFLLIVRAKRCLCRLLGMGMDARKRILAVYDAYLLGVILFHLLQRGE